ncbi:MAG: sigma-70 family RNA polymerase sigma factor [Balneolia bacterium]|nr:sigma-70 family RNA polymerase sigma factor [Balneolia bacterium]
MNSSITKAQAGEITVQLLRIKEGDDMAKEKLYQMVYDHLRFIATMELGKERAGHTLSRTELVHESFFKMLNMDGIDWEDRRHFYRISARAMRQILVEHARKKLAQKRGEKPERVTLHDDRLKLNEESEEIIVLSDALDELRVVNEKLAELVDLRFFVGLSMQDIADLTGSSRRTVQRDWSKAQAWLYKKLKADGT